MHVPVGPHIDALFDPVSREERINQTTRLNERSPESVGRERFVPFGHPRVTWHEYYSAPTANYYSGESQGVARAACNPPSPERLEVGWDC